MSYSIRGTILQTPDPGRLEVLRDHVVTVDDAGVITDVGPDIGERATDLVMLSGTVLLPGLIDTHIHAPQWPQLGTGLDLSLQRWLLEYTFPLEARYSDLAFAENVWESMVPALLSRATTTAVYHSSVHEPATLALAETCARYGQRAFVGRVAMDERDVAPEWYRDGDAADAVAASHRSIEAIRAVPGGLVEPIVTPRFIPACTDAALEGLGELARATGVRVQTHCSESDWEHRYVLNRCGRTDTEALSSFGLVTDHTVLAHATHLTGDDRHIIGAAGAGVSHCPLSNAYFANAVFPAKASLECGLRVGLGTDIAGGSEASMLAQCHYAVTASRLLEEGVDAGRTTRRGVADSRLDVPAAFWMATGGGADLLGIPAGLLAPGRVFDAFAVDIGPTSTIGVHGEWDDWDRIFEKIVRRASPSDITTVWVNGRVVSPAG